MFSKQKQTYWNKPVKEKEKKVYSIPKISKKKQERLKEWWSESKLFKQIALERSINGVVIAKHLEKVNWDIIETTKEIPLDELKPINFSHKLWKGMNSSLRLEKSNIEIVSVRFHFFDHNKQYLNVEFKN